MKVSELIEKLKEFDPELTVTFSDSEDGAQVVYDMSVHEDTWIGWNKATVLSLWGEYAEKEHIADKYYHPQEPPEHKPNPILDNLWTVYADNLVPKGTVYLIANNPPPVDAKYVTFPIHNSRDDKK